MKKEIKVLIIGSHGSVKGGITSVINRYLNYEFKSTKVTLLPTYIEGSALKKSTFFLSSFFKYLKKLVFNEFDVAHIHMSYKGSFFRKLIMVFLSKMFNKKVILHLHGSEFKVFYDNSSKFTKSLIRYILRMSSTVITLGDSWEEVIKNIEPSANVEVFRNAVDIPDYKVSLSNEKFNILFLGVLIKRKGIYELIEAIKIMNDKGLLEGNKLNFLIGGTGPEEAEVIKRINDYGLNNFIEMLGWVDEKNKADICKKSQLLVLPSYNEGLPMAILEAMSYGIPVIATDVGSIKELVNSKNGYIIEPKNVEDIVEAISHITSNLDKWDDYSNNAKKDVSDSFNENKYFEDIELLYRNIVQ